MKRWLVFLGVLVLLPALVFAQSALMSTSSTFTVANDTSTGTTVNLLAKLTSTGLIKATTSESVPLFVVISGAGTSGSAVAQATGPALCVMDATASNTEGQYVVASSLVAGRCAATATAPSGACAAGTMISNSTTIAQTATIMAAPLCFTSGGVTASSTDTFTNKTLDVEGTGNVVSMPVRVSLPAAGCNNTTAVPFWDTPTSTPAVETCVTGTNIQKGVLAFADTSGGFSAQTTMTLPVDWTTTGGVDVTLYWTTTATTGNAKWTVQFVCTDVAASATDDPAFPTSGAGFNTVTTAAPGTASRVQTSTITGATVPASCVTATRELLHIRLFRDGNDAADTIAATANLIVMELTFRRAM